MSSNNRKGLIRIFSFTLAFVIFVGALSFAFQGTSDFELKVEALESETVPMDALFIGGSSTFAFWSPMLAYEEYGFTSFDLSGTAMSPAMTLNWLKQSRSLCNTNLYIVDIRCFETCETAPETYNYGHFLAYSDAMPYSLERIKQIEYAYQYKTFEASRFKVYWKLPRTNLNILVQKMLGKYNNPDIVAKGQYLEKRGIESVNLNAYTDVSYQAELKAETVEVLNDLITYVQEEKLNVLFLISPFSFAGEETRAVYNSVLDIVNASGIPCLDANLYYEEIGLDGETDFYNTTHVNALGAEKFTHWLGGWLQEHYEFDNHNKDGKYSYWNEQAKEFDLVWDDLKNYYYSIISKDGEANE